MHMVNRHAHREVWLPCLAALVILAGFQPAPARDASLSMVRTAAEKGHPEAQYNLGARYESGRGVPRNYHKATTWFRRAAHQEHAGAQYRLAGLYERGWRVPPDRQQQGSPEFVAPDHRQALIWYKKAARNKHTDAQYHLAQMYENGRGVRFNYMAAANWYRHAARGGHVTAQFTLGAWYAAGLGMPRDKVKAYAWWSVAMTQGKPEQGGVLDFGVPRRVMDWQTPEAASRSRDRLAAGMTPEQVTEAQALAGKLACELLPRIGSP